MPTEGAPQDHPISIARAKELMAGDLGTVYRDILRRSCAPVYWFGLTSRVPHIINNGTLTFVRTSQRLLAVTAAHVFRGWEVDSKKQRVRLQVSNLVVDDLWSKLIDVSDDLDIATIQIDDRFLAALGRDVTPLTSWPPQVPQEGKGIMLAGYPAIERIEAEPFSVDFGLFTALVVARRVSEHQITWLVERDHQLENSGMKPPPEKYDLGGVSGGPLISWFESPQHVVHYHLSGIITQHPDYASSDFAIERIIASRADAITESGKIVS